MDGTLRIQFDRGWVSVTSGSGKALLEHVTGDANASGILSFEPEEDVSGGKSESSSGDSDSSEPEGSFSDDEDEDDSEPEGSFSDDDDQEEEPAVEWPAGELTVEVVSCSNLLIADMNGKSDPYVKVMMGKTTQQTRCIEKTLDPVFNEKLQPFAVDAESAEGAGQGQSLSVEVWDKDRSSDDFLGQVDVPLRDLCGEGLLKGGQVEKHYALGDAQGRLGRSEKQQAKQRKAKGKHQLEPLGAVDLKFQFASS